MNTQYSGSLRRNRGPQYSPAGRFISMAAVAGLALLGFATAPQAAFAAPGPLVWDSLPNYGDVVNSSPGFSFEGQDIWISVGITNTGADLADVALALTGPEGQLDEPDCYISNDSRHFWYSFPPYELAAGESMMCDFVYTVTTDDLSAGHISFIASAESSAAAVPSDLEIVSPFIPDPTAALIGDPEHVQVRADSNGNMAVFWEGVPQFYDYGDGDAVTDFEANNGLSASIGTNWIVNSGEVQAQSFATKYLMTDRGGSIFVGGSADDGNNTFGTLGAGVLSQPTADSIRVTWQKGGLTLAQTITVAAGDADAFRMQWSLTNNSAEVNSARVIWGGDTAFDGNDDGFSSINAAHTVITARPGDLAEVPMLITLTGDTPFDGWEGGNYSCMYERGGSVIGNLIPGYVTDDGLDQRECGYGSEESDGSVDMGNGVQYDTGALATGANWSKSATMRFVPIEADLSVSDAGIVTGQPGETVDVHFSVVNSTPNNLGAPGVTFTPGVTGGWSYTTNPVNPPIPIPANSVTPYTISVTIPETAQPGDSQTVTLGVTAGGITALPGTGTVTVAGGDPGTTVVPGSVAVSGTPKVGNTLTAVIGTPTPSNATPSYAWKLPDGTVIGAGSTLVIPKSAEGLAITLTVTWSATGYDSASESAATDTVQPDASGPAAAISLGSVSVKGMQTVTGTGFVEGESVTAVMHSTPFTIGTKTVGSSGAVTFTWKIPAGTEPGMHTVTLTGSISGPVSVEFLVTAEGDLVNTGFDAVPSIAIAALALGSGALLLMSSRRRRA